ncbi:putative Ig domain-containing protein [Prosthecobacter sp. SYSU 5D2]|uniref:putative Ig domain-containing protein n=1 Tax=Prosthecobacter sp. SYSU 5D2 TaxID=3134134 RepID=UPI0031FF3435
MISDFSDVTCGQVAGRAAIESACVRACAGEWVMRTGGVLGRRVGGTLMGRMLLLLMMMMGTGTVLAGRTDVEPPQFTEDFGVVVKVLPNGNYVVTTPKHFDGLFSLVGAVYLYDGATNGLISALYGEGVGTGGVEVLSNGHFVVLSPEWGAGRGAVTWVNGVTGLNAEVSAENSLVGREDSEDAVGSGGLTGLGNGSYVVLSPWWNEARGAVTWGSGTAGVKGVAGEGNSLVGAVEGDRVGSRGVKLLANGNYVVQSPDWNDWRGAATWGSRTTGVKGEVSEANSLVGNALSFEVGRHVIPLSNGHYVVSSPDWNETRGAVTWGNGTTGVTGAVSAANSLVGTEEGDMIGWGYDLVLGEDMIGLVVPLSNGHYVVGSPGWNQTRGAATWVNGNTGATGPVTAANSLVGTWGASYWGGRDGDRVGQTITALSNGHYVVGSPNWGSNRGAATWGNGGTGRTGTVTEANSLVGERAWEYDKNDVIVETGDRVGESVKALTTGHYVVGSPRWNFNRGAATWGNGQTGTVGTVTAANSLTGEMPGEVDPNEDVLSGGDQVGSQAVALAGGHYVVGSPNWHNGRGAATWRTGTGTTAAVVSAANSLVGSREAFRDDELGIDTPGDEVGLHLRALASGPYLVFSPNWNQRRGAVTWGSGTAGVSGVVGAVNSLVGSRAGDRVGLAEQPFYIVEDDYPVDRLLPMVEELAGGGFVVGSSQWWQGRGAATWGSATGGVTGEISLLNSIMGINEGYLGWDEWESERYLGGDALGTQVNALPGGGYVVVREHTEHTDGATVIFGDKDGAVSGSLDQLEEMSEAVAGPASGGLWKQVPEYNAVHGDLLIGNPGYNRVSRLTYEPKALTLVERNEATAEVGVPFSWPVLTRNVTSFEMSGLPEGLDYDPASGVISGTPAEAGLFEVQIAGRNGNNQPTGYLYLRVTVPLAVAVDAPDRVWTTSPDAPWFGQDDLTSDGVDAARSGPVRSYGSTWMETTVTGPCFLYFKWRVSSREDRDFLDFKVDGRVWHSLSGTDGTVWRSLSGHIPPGSHVLRWEYENDGGGSDGEDAGWVDEIVLTPVAGPVITSASSLVVERGVPFSYTITTHTEADLFTSAELPEGLVLDPATGVISGTTLVGEEEFSIFLGARNEDGWSPPFYLKLNVLEPIGPVVNVQGSGLVWNRGGNSSWSRGLADNEPHAVSGNKGESWIETTVTGPGILTFQWMAENVSYGERFQLTVGGVEMAVLRGTSDGWRAAKVAIPAGVQVLRWTYLPWQDGPGNWALRPHHGTAALDHVAFEATSAPFISNELALTAVPRVPFTHTVTVANGPAVFSASGLPDGLEMDASTGVISGTAVTAGLYAVEVTLGNGVESRSETLQLTVEPDLGEVLDAPELVWQTDGTGWGTAGAKWFGQTVTVDETPSAAQAGALDYPWSSGNATMRTTVTGPGTVTFKWKKSGLGSQLLFTILDASGKFFDGADIPPGQERDWEVSRTFELLPGEHLLRWAYYNGSPGTAAWVDEVTFVPDLRPWIISATEVRAEVGTAISHAITTTSEATSFAATGLPEGLVLDAETGMMTGAVAEPGVYEVTLTAVNEAGEKATTLTLHVFPQIGQALNAPGLVWTRGGNSFWFDQTEVSFADGTAAQTGANGETWMETTLTGPGTLFFKWKTVDAWQLDRLSVTLDGEETGTVPSLRGTTEWETVAMEIPPGTHTVRWSYGLYWVHDHYGVGWLDEVDFTPSLAPHISSALEVQALRGQAFEYTVTTSSVAQTLAATGLPAGLTFNAGTGLISGTPSQSGLFEVALSATNGEGTTAATLKLKVTIPIGVAVNALGLVWTSGGDLPWVGQAALSPDGEAAQSGALGDEEESWVETTVVGPATVSFHWRVSSERDYDKLSFTLDGSTQKSISGLSNGWQEEEYELAEGTHTLRWTYAKDDGAARGDDAAWLDQVRVDYVQPELVVRQDDNPLAYGSAVVNFGPVVLEQSQEVTLTLHNGGELPLTDIVAELDGTEAGTYTIVTPPDAELEAGEQTFVTVRFAPQTAGAHTATLGLASNDPQRNPFFITLSGTGKLPDIGGGDGRPVISPLVLSDTLVGTQVSLALSASNSPTKWTVKGLPKGLKWNAKTLMIEGVPTTPKYNKDGSIAPYAVTLSAANAKGTGPALALNWSILPLPDEVVGTFQALVQRDADVGDGLGGWLTASITTKGTVSGKIMLGAEKLSFKGTVTVGANNAVSFTSTAARKKPLAAYSVEFGFNEDHTIAGALKDGEEGADMNGWRNTWHAKDNPVPEPHLGRVNLLADLSGAPWTDTENMTRVPQGISYSALTLKNNGQAAWAGVLADGSKLTGSTLLGPDFDVALWANLYKGQGSVIMEGRLSETAALTGTGSWIKNPQEKPLVYAAGFGADEAGPVTLTVAGGAWSPAKGATVLGLQYNSASPAPNLWLTFENGGLELSAMMLTALPVTVNDKNKAAVPNFKVSPALNPGKAVVKITAATGLASGTFTLTDANPEKAGKTLARKVKFSGMLVPGLGDDLAAGGHFLLKQLAVPGATPPTTLKTAPTLSGRMLLLTVDPAVVDEN